MATVTIVLYRPVIEHMRSWNGDIGRGTLALCRRIRNFQRLYVPKKTGATMRSIEIGSLGHWAMGLETSVGANPGQPPVIGVAWWQEKGTRAHVIRPRPSNTRGVMTFYWRRVGRVVHRRRVFHPGNPATHWAMRGAASGMSAWN